MLFGLPVFADLASTFTLSDRTETRVRAPGTDPRAESFDIDNTADVRLAFVGPRSRYTLGYTPRFTLWDLASGSAPVTLQGGDAKAEWQISPFVHLTLSEAGSYGAVSFAGYSPTPSSEGLPPRVDVLPAPPVIRYESSLTTLAQRTQIARWNLDTSISYQIAGGANDDARVLLPLQKGPLALLGLGYAFTPRDTGTIQVTGSEAKFSTGPEAIITEADAIWAHRLTRLVDLKLTGGVSESRSRATPLDGSGFVTYPVVEGEIDSRGKLEDGRLELRAVARIGPIVNWLTGVVDERAQGTLAATYLYGHASVHAYGTAAHSIHATDQSSISLVTSDLGASYGLSDVVAIDGGVRALWQRDGTDGVSFLQKIAYVGVTLRAPPTRL